MAGEQTYIRLHIKYERPIEIGDFIGTFAGLSGQYDKFMRENHPELAPEADLFVTEMREGSIEADLLPMILYGSAIASIELMDKILIVEQFVKFIGQSIGSYLSVGGRKKDATSGDLKDFMNGISAIAHDSDGELRLEAIAFEDRQKKIKAAVKFTTKQAKAAIIEMEQHQIEIGRPNLAEYRRVLMVFSQTNIKDSKPGKRTNEKVTVEDVSLRDLPLVYGGNLVEERIKHEIREADENVFKKGFVVDISVETRNRKPTAYRVIELHQVIDLPDDED